MSNYVQTTFFAPKDLLLSGNPAKLIKGADVDPELSAIATAIASKYDSSNVGSAPILFNSGTVSAPGLAFVGDTGTGIYRPASSQVAISGGGSQIALFQSAGMTAPAFNATGSTVPANGIYVPSANNLGFSSNSTSRATVNASGNWIFNAPGSGTALQIIGLQGTHTQFIGPNTGAGWNILFTDSTASVNRGFIGIGTNTVTGAVASDFGIAPGASGRLIFGSANGAAIAVAVTSTGVLQAIDDAGTLQTVGWRDAVQNLQNSNYTLVLADRGKSVQFNGTSSWVCTIPANASVAFPVGTTILVVNNTNTTISVAITTDTMFLAGTNTSGTRTLAGNAVAMLYKATSTEWFISGQGVS